VIAQSVCGTISSIIFCWKIKNYFNAKKAKLTEAQYCQQLKSIYDQYKRKIHSLSHIEKQEVHPVKEEQ
jgi:Spy/CpxP family protein refolding chaperone